MSDSITSTVEAYLEAIFELDEIGERVTQARLARWFQVSPPATSEVVHRIQKLELLELTDDRSIVLTEEGRKLAETMAGRHRTIERYLVDVMGVPWYLADEETRKIEPGVSELVFERMRAQLGDANRCPHGNPIPGAPAVAAVELLSMDEVEPGSTMRIDRIREDLELDLDMLRYLQDHDLLPGREITVADRDPEGAVTVRREDHVVAVGPSIASHVLCAPA
ncbi:MAG TPA: metal-dependent transcriptional regulator [Actinomycetota bacterium]|nr:metal-dependent transcriptional regulator [Actinomycetota bacterium]